ncbi:hypothetical protein ACFU6I_30750 [Streptomyces sp. NPDC057486]|uniref:hypothetical protein n=1 Tax=Streptomyces sp. NPDC057486 TaxID=3346145 RepID=UPI0036770CD8
MQLLFVEGIARRPFNAATSTNTQRSCGPITRNGLLKPVGVTMPWVAVGIAVVAAAALELVWRWVDRRFPA